MFTIVDPLGENYSAMAMIARYDRHRQTLHFICIMKKSNIGGNKYLVNLCGGLLPRCWFDAGLGK
jgi:hypothetical protein